MRARTGAMNSRAPASLRYCPAVDCRNLSTAARFFCSCDAQAASVAAIATMATVVPAMRLSMTLSAVISAPLCLITGAEREQFLEQLGVTHTRRFRRLGEILLGREVRVRVRLDHVDLPVRVHAVVDARAAREAERAIDAP